jgi:hypothetical protein
MALLKRALSSAKAPPLVALLSFVGLFGWQVWLGTEERERMAALVPGAYFVGPQVAADTLAADLVKLNSTALKIRPAGSYGSGATQEYLARRFTEIGLTPYDKGYRTRFSFHTTSKWGLVLPNRSYYTDYEATNMVGYIRGSAFPSRYLVISARYDAASFSPKTEGNDTGVATMLAIATYLKQHPPLNTVVFVAFDSSELGQVGANIFLETPPMPRDHIAMNLNLDIVGKQGDSKLVIAGTHHTPALIPVVHTAAQWSHGDFLLGHDRPRRLAGSVDDWTYVSDHAPFHAQGIPFLFATIEERGDRDAPTLGFDQNCCAKAANFLLALAVTLDQQLDHIKPRR